MKLLLLGLGCVGLLAAKLDAQGSDRARGQLTLELTWTRFMGGSSTENLGWMRSPILDHDGRLTFTGTTLSPDFPTTPDALFAEYRGGNRWGQEDIFLAQFDTRRPGLIYSTLLGGAEGPEHASDAKRDDDGNIYLVGNTGSSDFPTTDDALTPLYQGPVFRHADGFLAILGDNGRKLSYSTFIGGRGNDWVDWVFIDPTGEATLFGVTESPAFFTAESPAAAPRRSPPPAPALFVMRLDATGRRVLCSGLLANTWATGIQRLDSGDFLIAGTTADRDFATTEAAFDRSYNGGSENWGGDVFVMRLTADLQTVSFATLFGGAGEESSVRIAVIPGGDFFVQGGTTSKDLPVTPDALERTIEKDQALFLARFSGDGRGLKYCTYLGGQGTGAASFGNSLVYDGHSRIYLAGNTPTPGFPITPHALQPIHHGGRDLFLLALNTADNSLAFGTYWGGSGNEREPHLVFDTDGTLYVLGTTDSDDFPTLAADRSELNGEADIFIAKFSLQNRSTRSQR